MENQMTKHTGTTILEYISEHESKMRKKGLIGDNFTALALKEVVGIIAEKCHTDPYFLFGLLMNGRNRIRKRKKIANNGI